MPDKRIFAIILALELQTHLTKGLVRHMKTLIINGSPRKNGDCATLIAEMQKHLMGETKMVSAYHDNIRPCVDCRYCWKKPGCCVEDDMQDIYRALNEVDHVVLASPLYFSELTGELLSLASRLQMIYAAKRFQQKPLPLKRKNGVLILTGGGDGYSKKGEETAHTLLKFMNAPCVANVFSLRTDDMPASQDEEALQAARAAARMLNEL